MLLMTPGSTPVPEAIRIAMSEPIIHHRTPEFEDMMELQIEFIVSSFTRQTDDI